MNSCQVVWNHQPAIGWVTSAAQSNLLCFTHLRWEAWAKEALLSLHLVSLGAGGIRGMEYMAKWLLENCSWLQIMLIFISKRAKPSELPRLLGKQTVWLRHRGFVRQRKDVSMYPLNNQLSHPDNLSHPWQMNLSFDCSCPVPYDLPILPERLVGHAVKTCVSAVTRPVKWPTNHLFTSGSAMLYGIFWVEPQMDQWSERLVDSDWLVQLENKQITQWNLTWWSIFKRSLIWITLEEGPASQQCPQVALGEWFWVKPQWWAHSL